MDQLAEIDQSSEWLLRLEVPLPTECHENDFRVTWQCDELENELGQYFDFAKPKAVVRTEGDFSDTVECTFYLKPRQLDGIYPNGAATVSTSTLLSSCVREFYEKLATMAKRYREEYRNIGPEWRGTVFLHSPNWFNRDIDSFFNKIPLLSLHFGVFFRGMFHSHWEVSYGDAERRKGYLRDVEVEVDCHFDQNNISVLFFNHEKNAVYKPNQSWKTDGFALYRVQVQIQTIRRVIVEMRDRESAVLYLELTTPAIVKKSVGITKAEAEKNLQKRYLSIYKGAMNLSGSSESALVENPVLALEFKKCMEQNFNVGGFVVSDVFWRIISRLRLRCKLPIEFCTFEMQCIPYAYHVDPYCEWSRATEECKNSDSPATHPKERIFADFLYRTFDWSSRSQNKEDKRMVHYLIEALISRGAVVKDHILLRKDDWDEFLQTVHGGYKKNPQAMIEALKRLLLAVDEQKRIYSITLALRMIFVRLTRSDESFGLTEEEMKEGYQLVPRVVITPSRNLRIQPEMCMGNRVLRGMQGEQNDSGLIIRVSFRDDDNRMMRVTTTSARLLERTIKQAFDKGIFIAGKRYFYLGSSSSQMRDCGAYFMLGLTDRAAEEWKNISPDSAPNERLSIKLARQNLGRFLQLKTAPKIMARLGQCFTQSRVSGICLERHSYSIEPDLIGGRKKLVDEPYCFTDGVASMNPLFAKRVSDDMRLNSVPSCYQYRFRGHKGVQVVDPYLQEVQEWAQKHRIPNPPSYKDIRGSWKMDCLFRPSQIKFNAKRYDQQPIEIVKFSGPTSVCLNKPLINIFDQVSGMQSHECHTRITNRIEDLLNIQIRTIVRTLLSERHCRNKLKELPKRFDIDLISHSAGFELCREPFFSSLLRAAVRFQILKQLRKEQIQIPPTLGRSLLGVNDITNQLQYGQIFVQYTNDIRDYSPKDAAKKTIVTGKVMVTKNPTSVSGDVRLFEAVDIPELHHLVDVVVFPVHGPRSMPDEMAGSDLDGDEYSVFWDPKLLIDHNVEPAVYETEAKQIDEVTEENLDEKVRDAFVAYAMNDNIGGISNALLFQSDLYGIDTKVVNDLALKANKSLEFLKSGIAPERLRSDWIQEDPEDPNSEWLPPEKAERYPDFHISNDYSPIYISPRLTGRLYREIKQIEDVLRVVEEKDRNRVLEIDSQLEVPGWQLFERQVKETMDSYNGKLRMVMEMYGIATEAELLTGYICDMRNRITDKDQDDFSYYNQRTAIETRTTEIMREFREKFYDEFGGWRNCTREEDYRDEDNIFRRRTIYQPIEMKQKASAYYMVTYRHNMRPRAGQPRMLSFAWLLFDILNGIRQHNVFNVEDHVIHSMPVLRILDNHIEQFTRAYVNRHAAFWTERKETPVIERYCQAYPGLVDVLFVLECWASFGDHLNIRFRGMHLSLLFILFATGRMVSVAGNAKVYLAWLEKKVEGVEDEVKQVYDKGDLVLAFFEYLSSRNFKTLTHISFAELGVNSVFMRGEWLKVYKGAVKTYMSIAFSMNFDDLPLDKNGVVEAVGSHELDPFIIEIPEFVDIADIQRRLLVATGVEQVRVRRIVSRQRKDRAVVVCKGTLEACYRLRHLVAVKPSLYNKYNAKQLSEMMPTITLSHIIAASDEAVSHLTAGVSSLSLASPSR